MSEANLEQLRTKLTNYFAPEFLELEDESNRHRGHREAQPGKKHLRLRIVSQRFSGQPTLDRHRAVYALLAEELRSWVHALSLEALTPEEWQAHRRRAT